MEKSDENKIDKLFEAAQRQNTEIEKLKAEFRKSGDELTDEEALHILSARDTGKDAIAYRAELIAQGFSKDDIDKKMNEGGF